jgi:hypothetical protein
LIVALRVITDDYAKVILGSAAKQRLPAIAALQVITLPWAA